jgi:transposase-like protein
VQACELVQKEGAKPKIVAEKMGLNITVFYRWLSDYATYGEEAFVGRGYQRTEEAKVKRIEKENKMLKQENEILKKAAAYFAKEKGKD